MTDAPSAQRHAHVTCPFCGLACDDLEVSADAAGVRVEANGCPISEPAFAFAAAGIDRPAIAGEPVALAAAVARAAAILRNACAPLIAGLGTDVAGMRAALQLAESIGATVDHMNGEALRRNVRVLQDTGWITTTLSEVKNRADLVVFVGVDVSTHFPRFFERLLEPAETLFAPAPPARDIVFLGEDAPNGPASKDGGTITVVPCPRESLGEAINLLRSLVRGQTPARTGAGIDIEALRDLAARLKQARYGVIVWAAGQLDFPHADLAIEALAALIKQLNRTTRCAGLPLGGRDGDVTANQLATWQTGYPLPIRFARGYPDYDPHRYAGERLLARGEADALLWISAFDAARQPPPASVPTVVLARAGTAPSAAPDVYIPVATPGVDHAGQIFRCDSVVALPLRALRTTELPSVAHVLGAIGEQLQPGTGAPC